MRETWRSARPMHFQAVRRSAIVKWSVGFLTRGAIRAGSYPRRPLSGGRLPGESRQAARLGEAQSGNHAVSKP